MIKFDVITIFPDQIEQFIQFGIFRIAATKGLVEVNVHDLRKWTTDRHRSVDDRPYGGGAGMVLKIEPIYKALTELKEVGTKVIALTPSGDTLKQANLIKLSRVEPAHYIILCGHYEGFDQRILDNLVDIEISLGDFVLSGGETPALALMDGIIRLVPGVLGNEFSKEEESFENSLLEYPHYTRPEEFEGWKVPEVLLNGNHKEISAWRFQESKKRTGERRPDLIKTS